VQGSTPNFKILNRSNSVADCSISLKFCTAFEQVTGSPYLTKVQYQGAKGQVTA